MSSRRRDGRANDDLRPVVLTTGFTRWPEGSVLACFGETRVMCTASVEERLPPWMKDQGRGWVTAEYSMLPRATDRRNQRESTSGKVGGRTHEISRLIGRALRAAVDTKALGERSVTLDCDVLQADGGTRTTAITGAWLALALAIRKLQRSGAITRNPLRRHVAAVSLGVRGGEVLLDLDQAEDQEVDTDLNLVMTDDGGLVEVQGTAERTPYSRAELDRMLDLGRAGIDRLVAAQKAALEAA
jgi:ribonuclease PH